jgi:cell wall-associated NlpC family hydrolase
MVTGAMVVAEARTWVGTRWHRNASLKRYGADCIGVVAGTALALGLPVRYRSNYSQTPDGSLRRELAEQCTPLDKLEPGAVLLMAFMPEPHHVGIYTGEGIVHAYAQVRRCVFSPWEKYWAEKLRGIYRLPGVTP